LPLPLEHWGAFCVLCELANADFSNYSALALTPRPQAYRPHAFSETGQMGATWCVCLHLVCE